MNKPLRSHIDFRPRKNLRSVIEPLENRIAPAVLVSPTTVTYQDKYGDTVTVLLSRPLFTPALVNKIFTFDTGSVKVGGSDTTQQQLETLNLDWIGAPLSGTNVSITVPQTNNGPVYVGYINSSGIDLGAVKVDGDLGRIAAGGFAYIKPALVSLTVDSIGALGTTTQAAKGSLNTLINGRVGLIMVNGDIDNANIGIGGGAHGVLDSLVVRGDINGGFNNVTANFAGSVNVQGGILSVEVDGSLIGGEGNSSGTIGTTGHIGTVYIGRSIEGGLGTFSGALLSKGAIGSGDGTVQIGGSIIGGGGTDSGQIGTASNLAVPVSIAGNVEGGDGNLSGVILATGSITSVTVGNALIGGGGRSSGQIGAGQNIGTIRIGAGVPGGENADESAIAAAQPAEIITGKGIQSGSGAYSGSIIAGGNIQLVAVFGELYGATDLGTGQSPFSPDALNQGAGPLISAGGNLNALLVSMQFSGATVTSGGSIGAIIAVEGISYSTIHAKLDISQISANYYSASIGLGGTGILDCAISAVSGSIGSLYAGGGLYSSAIDDSTFIAGAGVGNITAYSNAASGGAYSAISDSHFDSGGNIGNLNLVGSIDSSNFIAGANTTAILNGTTPALAHGGRGGFGLTTGASGASIPPLPSHIGNITLTDGGSIENTTFTAGVLGPGPDKIAGTADDNVVPHSTIGSISAPGGMSGDFVESGTIGATTSGAMSNDTYLAIDTSALAGGIGDITVTASSGLIITGSLPQANGGIFGTMVTGISSSTFISNAGIGDISVTLTGPISFGTSSGIDSSSFSAGHLLGSILVTDNLSAFSSAAINYGISNSTFYAGVDGYGGIGNIRSVLSGTGSETTTAAIYNSQFDSSILNGGNFGSIYAENANGNVLAAGIVDSVFRTHGNIASITAIIDNGVPTAPAINGSTFSADGVIGDITVTGMVYASEF